MIYFYDGTFDGFLTSVFYTFQNKDNPEKILPLKDKNVFLFQDGENIKTDVQKADRVFNGIKEKVGKLALRNVIYAFASELKDIEITLYEYICLGFQHKKKIYHLFKNKWVEQIIKTCEKVSKEVHRLKGLLRFKKLNTTVFYAPLMPDYNIIQFLAPHFKNRMSDQYWVIHDLKRDKAVYYDTKNWEVLNLEPGEINKIEDKDLSDDEKHYQELWKTYFKNIAIKERKNLKQQKQFMPQRYWQNLIEK